MTIRGTLMLCTIAGALLLGAETKAQTLASVTLGWNASPSSDVSGYAIFYGTSSGNYTMEVPVSNVTNVTIKGLTSGKTYYFAAAALDSAGDQSAMSPEISVTAGAEPAQGTPGILSALTSSAGHFGFTLSGASGAQYIVQGSTDLVHWVTLQTNTAPFNFVDSNSSQFSHRFYRTAYTSN